LSRDIDNTKIIDVIGKPCPIPVIEAKKALAEHKLDSVQLKVDNFIAVQNLEKMANGRGYDFSYTKSDGDLFDVTINKQTSGTFSDSRVEEQDRTRMFGVTERIEPKSQSAVIRTPVYSDSHDLERSRMFHAYSTIVVISRDTMGEGTAELGEILIKGFVYALSELPLVPEFVIFLNSGAHLTSVGYNTIDDLIKLEAKGAKVLTCGTCVNYYGLPAPAVGSVTDMYDIVIKMANAEKVINI